MHRRKKVIISASALGVLAASAIAWGVNEGTPPGPGSESTGFSGPRWGQRHGGPVERMARHLDLSDEQRQKIEAILAAARSEGESLRSQLASLRSEAGTMIREGRYFEDQARIMVESKSPVFVDLTLLGIRTMSQVYAELTPEQRDKADAMMASRRGGFGGRGWGFPAE